jgi:hypothetical protein
MLHSRLVSTLDARARCTTSVGAKRHHRPPLTADTTVNRASVVHTRLIFTAHNNRSTSESAKLSAIMPADMCAPGPFGTHIYWGDRRVRGRPRSGKSGDRFAGSVGL